MKLAPAAIANFLAKPFTDKIAVLLHGSDDGLIRERAAIITRAVLGSDGDDPFRLILLTPDQLRKDAARLSDEARSMSLLGGRRVIRIREAGDSISDQLKQISGHPPGDALIILEAGNLDSRSSLRKIAEGAPDIAAIACYPDGPREIAALIRETLRAENATVAEDALLYLTESLGGNRLMTRQEIEKLALFAGPGGHISLEHAVQLVGDSSLLALDDLIYDVLDGRLAEVGAGLSRLFQEGEAPVTILRAALRHAHRLHLASAKIAGGDSAETVMRAMRPPIFYKLADRFRAQLRAWPPVRTQKLLLLLEQAEAQCKRTGFPDQVICGHAMLAAARLSGGSGGSSHRR